MHNNTDCVHRGVEIIYTSRGGYGFCVGRLVRSNFIPEIEYQNIATPTIVLL